MDLDKGGDSMYVICRLNFSKKSVEKFENWSFVWKKGGKKIPRKLEQLLTIWKRISKLEEKAKNWNIARKNQVPYRSILIWEKKLSYDLTTFKIPGQKSVNLDNLNYQRGRSEMNWPLNKV